MGAVLGDGVDHVVDVDLDVHAVGRSHHHDLGGLQLRHDRVPQLVGDVDHARESET